MPSGVGWEALPWYHTADQPARRTLFSVPLALPWQRGRPLTWNYCFPPALLWV